MSVGNFTLLWKRTKLTDSCEDCSKQLPLLRKKKTCYFCKNSFCQDCVVRQERKRFCCQKCQILTARPLDKSKLLNLRSRDLINYLTSRRIPTNGCVEKEDLVNVLIKAVNNSSFHPSSSACIDSSSSSKSYPNSPRSCSDIPVHLSQSTETLQDDGIRITGHNSNDSDTLSDHNSPYDEKDSSQEDDQNPNGVSDRNEPTQEMPNDPNLTSGSQSCEPSPLKKPLLLSDIKNKSDLDALSVKQLKELLMRNRMDFTGCIERGELIQKANRLWSDYIVSRKDLENLSLNELCKICMDAPIECVLLECGHMATCTSCGKQLCECPICRQLVVRCVRTFKA